MNKKEENRRRLLKLTGGVLLGGGVLYAEEIREYLSGDEAGGSTPKDTTTTTYTTTDTPTTTTDRTTTGTTTDTTTTEGPTTTGQEIKVSELSHDEFVEEYQDLSASERQELFDVEDYEELVDGDPDNMEIERVKVEYNPSDDPDDSEISYKLESGGAYSPETKIPDSLARELLDLN